MPSTLSETTDPTEPVPVTTIDAHQHVWDLSVRDQFAGTAARVYGL